MFKNNWFTHENPPCCCFSTKHTFIMSEDVISLYIRIGAYRWSCFAFKLCLMNVCKTYLLHRLYYPLSLFLIGDKNLCLMFSLWWWKYEVSIYYFYWNCPALCQSGTKKLECLEYVFPYMGAFYLESSDNQFTTIWKKQWFKAAKLWNATMWMNASYYHCKTVYVRKEEGLIIILETTLAQRDCQCIYWICKAFKICRCASATQINWGASFCLETF